MYSAEKAEKLSKLDLELIEEIGEYITGIRTNVDALIEARKVANKIDSEYEKALSYHDDVLPYFEAIREHADKLEMIVDDEMWTLPKYRELLFIR